MALNLNVPQMNDEFSPRICVVGVGGAGGNAINNMIASGLEGVEFLVCNTDAQDLSQSMTENRVQLGPNTTQGLGAGMQPHVGANAAQESLEEILHHLEGANMVFVTAGMGGGTGTGAAPVIARALRDKNILTVGVVTKPFQFEGMKRSAFAEEGIANMTEAVDTLIVIPNQNLFRLADERTTFADAFKMADNVLLDGVRSVSDLIVKPGIVNLDFADVRTLMTLMGKAMMGTGEGEGETRALDAANRAIANPLLDDMSLDGAQGVLINVSGGADVTLYEVDVVANQIRNKVDPDANIIFGSSIEEDMDGAIRVSVVATGIDADSMPTRTTPPTMPGGPTGPSGGPSGPTGPAGGPSGGGPRGGQPAPQPAPAPQQQQPSAPMSPFGRSPFAFRGNGNGGNGPTSALEQPQEQAAAPQPMQQTTQQAMHQPAPVETSFAAPAAAMPATPAVEAPATPRLAAAAAEPVEMSVSPNYAPVPPASMATHAPQAEPAPAPAPELSLFSQAPAPQAEAAIEQEAQASFPTAPSAPAPQPGLGGLFSRFAAPRQETAPTPSSQPNSGSTPTAFGGGAAVAAANAGMQAVARAEEQQMFYAPAPEAQTVSDLDSPAQQQSHVDVHGSANTMQVVDLDDSANNGLENFDQSYKSVPAFLRHQNN